jgi:hypothetical protein
MRLLAPLLILGAALAALLLTPAGTPILGLAHQAFAGAAALTALLAYLLRWTRASDIARATGSLTLWAMALLALTGAYIPV